MREISSGRQCVKHNTNPSVTAHRTQTREEGRNVHLDSTLTLSQANRNIWKTLTSTQDKEDNSTITDKETT